MIECEFRRIALAQGLLRPASPSAPARTPDPSPPPEPILGLDGGQELAGPVGKPAMGEPHAPTA
jgi:hypothetical protein